MEWKHFKHELPGIELLSNDEGTDCYYEFVPNFIAETGYLPLECRECYKALIFWSYSKANEENYKKLVESLPVSIHGKYNESVVVFYFKAKAKMLDFLEILKGRMEQFGVQGRLQWRVSGRYWQDDYPQFFNSAKELTQVQVDKEITMKEWIKQKGISY